MFRLTMEATAALLVGMSLSGVFAWVLFHKSKREQQLREQLVGLQERLAAELRQSEEKVGLLATARSAMAAEFKSLAGDVFDEKQKLFRQQSTESIKGLLDPLGERIKEFEKRVEETYDRESKERFSLTREISNLQELNRRISKDALNLTNALKGNTKVQGNWGELVLERLLEAAGLQKGREFEVQVSHRGEVGRRLQPDVVIHLPGDRHIIIDSKVSLLAYEKYVSGTGDAPDPAVLGDHVRSLKNHVKALSQKQYQQLEGLRTLDFVLMFVPIEAAVTLALESEPALFTDALSNNVVVATPTTLLATLRTIQYSWRLERQDRNAREIAEGAGRMYDKLVGFVEDLEDIGARIDAARESYEKAHNKLASGTGNLVKRAESMRNLGARASKRLPDRLLDSD